MTDRRDHTRAAIVEAAARLMTEHGVRATTVEQIAREAYVSVGAIYTHFAGKVGLALYFVDVGLNALQESMEQARQPESPVERVRAAGVAYLQFAVDHPVAARFAAARVMDPDPAPEYAEANDICSRRVRPVIVGIARDVRAAMEAGQMRRAPIEETVSYLWAVWSGTAALMLRQDEFTISHETGLRALEVGRSVLEAPSDERARRP